MFFPSGREDLRAGVRLLHPGKRATTLGGFHFKAKDSISEVFFLSGREDLRGVSDRCTQASALGPSD